jgi:hypothetical protein
MSLIRRQFEVLSSLDVVLKNTLAIVQANSVIVLSRRISLIRRQFVVLSSPHKVLPNPKALKQTKPKQSL